MGVSTGFVKVAQSGKTIDGREIKPEWLLESAETYDTAVYTANVFPDHNLNDQSYGTVRALQAKTDKSGVVSLYADIQPNAFWQSDMRYGQNMFTSIAVMPNFAGTGKFYMYSLAATNNPASLGVEQLQFSKIDTDKAAMFSAAFDTKTAQPEPEETKLFSLLKDFFTSNKSTDMSAKDNSELTALQQKFSTMEAELNKLKAGATKEPDTDQAAKFTALEKENTELKAKVAELESKNTENQAQFASLTSQFTELKKTLDDALKEQPGTPAGKQFGAGDTKDETIYA